MSAVEDCIESFMDFSDKRRSYSAGKKGTMGINAADLFNMQYMDKRNSITSQATSMVSYNVQMKQLPTETSSQRGKPPPAFSVVGQRPGAGTVNHFGAK